MCIRDRHIDEENRLVRDFHQKLAHTKIQTLQIISLRLTSKRLQQQSAILVEHLAKLKILWPKIKIEAEASDLEEIKPFLKTYANSIEAYLHRLEIIAEQLNRSLDSKTAQQLVLEFVKEDVSIDLPAALEAMEELEKIGDKIEDRTREDLELSLIHI